MIVRGDFVPADDLSPAVVLLTREFEHFAVLAAVAISVYESILRELVSLPDPAHFLGPGTVSVNVLACQAAVASFQGRADAGDDLLLSHQTATHVERVRDHD